MTRYLDPLALGFVLWGVFQLLIAGGIGLLFGGLGGLLTLGGMAEGDGELLAVGVGYGGIGMIVAVFAAVMALPSLAAGLGLWRRSGWARIVALVVGALALTSMPFGTLLGVAAFVVLMDKDVAQELA